ncbi:MAG: hypothetical protein ABII93_02040 [Chrysiogenia bacterium]
MGDFFASASISSIDISDTYPQNASMGKIDFPEVFIGIGRFESNFLNTKAF